MLIACAAILFAAVFAHSLHAQVDERVIGDLVGAASASRAGAGQEMTTRSGLDLLTLLIRGGVFMIPIGIVSIVVVMFVVERSISLRRGRLYPRRFQKSVLQFSKQLEADPRIVYQSCLEHPSPASDVLRTLLLQVGRPVSELKGTVSEKLQREADRAYGNVRWLNFSAGVAPLLGLLGTVWGLIRAFHDTTQLTAGQNRADYLAAGIYEALITTLAGLIVAIPAAIASHYFEGKITRIFNSIEEDLFGLLPRFEQYEGRTRFELIGREIAPRDARPLKSTTIPSPPIQKS